MKSARPGYNGAMKRRGAGVKTYILSLGLAGAAIAFAGASPGARPSPLPEDPPKAFFSSELGDAEVELLIEGLWEASLRSAAGFSSGPSGGYFNASPLLFTQRPDLYILLTFMERWWFEAAVAEELARSRFALGFSGGDDDTIKEARLGNNGVTMADYPYLAFGSPLGAFGASLRAERGGARFDAMARWDGLSWRTRRFFGLGESQESEIRPEAFIRGRSFVLPHANVEGLRLYDVVAGTPRLLAPDEYGASAARGTALLNAAPRGTLYAYYLRESNPLGGAAPDATVDGYPVVKLYERGKEPILEREALNLYALPQGAAGDELFVRSLASGLPDLNYLVERLGNGLVQVTFVSGPMLDERDPEYLRPFEASGDAPWVYLDPPAPGTAPDYPAGSGFAVVSRGFIALSALSIEANAVAGTVSLTRDGVPSLDFDHDAKSGALTLYPPPRAGERIEVRYAVASQDRDDGGIVFGAGTRFPWLGLEWALAAGGRWSLPGQAYAEGGELRPGWAGLSAEARYANDGLSFRADAFLRYGRESAASVYRAAGMEEGDAKSPFRLLDAPTGVIAAGARADVLLDAFPERMKPFHAQGQANYALKINASEDTPDPISLVRYVEPVPIAAFNEFAFFVRFEGAAPDGKKLTVRIDDGSDGPGGAGLSLRIDDMSDLGAGWALVTLRLNPAAPTARIERYDGGVHNLTPGVFDPSAPVSRIHIKIDGLDADDVVWIDELHLADPRGGFSVQGSADLALGAQKPADRAAGKAYLTLGARGQLAASGGDEQIQLGEYAGGSVVGSAEAGFSLGPSAWILRAAPRYADGEASLAAGYALYLPRRGAPSFIYDEFSRDAALGLYARELGAGLSLFDGALKASASAKSQEQAMRFNQSWAAALAWATKLRLELGASIGAPLSPLDTAGLGEAWLRSWELAVPLREAEIAARQRSLSAKAGFFGDILRLNAAQDYAKPNQAAAQESGSGGAALGYGFKLGRLVLRPSYERSTQARGLSDSPGLADDLQAWADSAARLGELWGAVPIYELWDPDLAELWADSSAAYAAASHRSSAGASLSRPIGFGLTDLWAPSEASASYARLLERSGDQTSDAGVTSLALRHGAANLFGRNGARPTLASVEFDEYGSNAELKLTRFASDGAVLPSLSLRHAASFEGSGGWGLSLSNRFFWERTRSAERWNDGLGARLVTRPERTWFSRFLSLVLPLGSEEGKAAKPGSVGAWLQEVWRREPTLRDSYSLELKLGSSGGDASPLTLGLDLVYETRVIQAGTLSFGFSAKFGAEYRAPIGQGLAYWGGGYEITLDGRVSF